MVHDLMRFELITSDNLPEACDPRRPETVVAAIRLYEASRAAVRYVFIYNGFKAVLAPLNLLPDCLDLTA